MRVEQKEAKIKRKIKLSIFYDNTCLKLNEGYNIIIHNNISKYLSLKIMSISTDNLSSFYKNLANNYINKVL